MTLLPKLKRRNKNQSDSAPLQSSQGQAALDYCQVLLHPEESDAKRVAQAWNVFGEKMAMVPGGEVLMSGTTVEELSEMASASAFDPVQVEPFYVDRTCVTNAEFAEFVAAGGYLDEHLWPAEILANVLQFVDQTDQPAPRYWSDGVPPKRELDHPVTGICWYEANAFAHWMGKRLPSPAEWQWAAIWANSSASSGGLQTKFPWGDSFDPKKCNTWNSGVGTTVPVSEYYSGCTPNGVYQLIGNVWEWTAALFECQDSPNGDRVLTEVPMAEVRGGAFNTYFASQATAQYRTGQSLLFRGHNHGFRCVIGADLVSAPTDPYSFLEENES